MKTLENNNMKLKQREFNVSNQKISINVVEKFWHKEHAHGITLELKSPLFEEGNFHLSIKNNRLKLLLTEVKEINSPITVHHLNKSIFKHTYYERLRAFDIKIPKGQYYIANKYFIPEKNMIKIVLNQHLN